MLWKSQTQVSHSPCLQGTCTEMRERRKSSNVYNAREKKHKKEFSNRNDDFCQRFWVWASRRRSGNELDLEEWIDVNMQKWEWVGEQWSFQTQGNLSQEGWRRDWHLLKCRVCNLPCLVLHLRPLALYVTGNRHLIHAHWKLNEKETKFRAWMSDHPMV